MAKIAQISAKYIIHTTISIEGVVDRPDVIGAIFGQTEGLLGADLELRELQRSGRIGRIEVNVGTKGGKTSGEIIIPSSLDKAETAIVGAALEIIQRIGPCNAALNVQKIEDIRISKRKFVIDRAKELLKNLMDSSMPDSQELADEVATSVRVMEITEWGRERLPAGPGVEDSDEITIVEGRADVLTLLKHGFKNAVAINGTSMPPSIADLCKQKVVTVFVDGDRGGDLIIKELQAVAEIDFITKAPDGKEVEELTKKEIHKALRSKVAAEQHKMESNGRAPARNDRRAPARAPAPAAPRRDARAPAPAAPRRDARAPAREAPAPRARATKPSEKEKKAFNEMLEDLIGTRGAYILDKDLNILGKVPTSELESTIKSLKSGIHAVVFDGEVGKPLADVATVTSIKFLVAMSAKVTSNGVAILTTDDLE
ncbi:DNA primase [Candidatus Woesearchaeota archaeon]|nr:DNA primase [Candidatus Woesearchaeota archaeon]